MGTPLHLAASYGHLHCARALVGAGADPRLRDSDGKRAIEYAQRYSQTEVAKFLNDLGSA